MKRLCIMALLCLSIGTAKAQIEVELTFDQETFLPHERLPARVRVHNTSGQTLILGKDDAWLTFHIEAVDGSIVRIQKNPDVAGEFSLPSAHRATKRVDLSEAFDLSRFGRYEVVATVQIKEWGGQAFASRKRHFDISTGVKLWETAFGVPSAEPGERPEIRKYVLSQANHLKEINLYVRITDDLGQYTYKVFPLGPMISFSRPEAQMDQWSNLHILYQKGARDFLYNKITPDGMLLERQTWDYSDTRPQLGLSKDGRIIMKGGVRRISASDLPPPELLSEKAPSALPPAAGAERLVDGNAPQN